MTDAGFFRGTSAEQDNRFSDKEKKLLKQMKFGENVAKKVDMSKIKVDVLRPWISKRVEDLLGMEDDVIEEFVVNQLEANQFPDGRRIQINLTGFLNGKNARIFTAELWDMLLSAQEQSTGIPASILESKQEEIKKRNEEQEKLSETLKKTVSRFNDKLKNERDSSPPLPSSRSADLPSSSPPTRASGSNIKREKISPEPNRDLDSASTTINRRKDDGGRRNYRSRRSSSPSPTRRSRSRSRDRDRRDYRRDRSPPRGGAVADRRRDRSRSPVKVRRSPVAAARSSYRDNRSRSRDRDRERETRTSASISSSNRRYSDYRDRDRERDTRSSRDVERDRRRSRSREERDRSRGLRRDSDYAQNGSSSSLSHFRHPPSPPPQQHSRHSSREKEVRRFTPVDDDYRGPKGAPSSDREVEMSGKKRDKTPPQVEQMEENSERSGDSAQEGSPVAKKSKKEKKSKKDKKKHKKHKKGKKSKRSKNGTASRSASEDDDDDDDNSASDDDENGNDSSDRRGGSSSTFLKYIDTSGGVLQSSDDLERKLREKALESLKKANSSR